MSGSREPVTELDLMAYADGLLEGDPGRRAIVEAYLEQRPHAAAFVEEIRAQNAAIRDRYERLLSQPVPEKLAAALDRRGRHTARLAARAAVLAVLLASSAGLGWFLGSGNDPDRSAVQEFLDQAARYHRVGAASGLGEMTGMQEVAAPPLALLSQRIALEIVAPDLSELGYTLTDKRRIGPPDDTTVRLTYQDERGAHVSLFLRPRWAERTTPAKRVDEAGVTVRHWLDGPLEVVLAMGDEDPNAERLVSAIHEAIEGARLREAPPAGSAASPAVNLDRSLIEGTGGAQNPEVGVDQPKPQPVKAN